MVRGWWIERAQVRHPPPLPSHPSCLQFDICRLITTVVAEQGLDGLEVLLNHGTLAIIGGPWHRLGQQLNAI